MLKRKKQKNLDTEPKSRPLLPGRKKVSSFWVYFLLMRPALLPVPPASSCTVMLIVVMFYRYKPSTDQTVITDRVTADFGVLSTVVGAAQWVTTGLNCDQGEAAPQYPGLSNTFMFPALIKTVTYSSVLTHDPLESTLWINCKSCLCESTICLCVSLFMQKRLCTRAVKFPSLWRPLLKDNLHFMLQKETFISISAPEMYGCSDFFRSCDSK